MSADGLFTFGDSSEFKLHLDPELMPEPLPEPTPLTASNPDGSGGLQLKLDNKLMDQVQAIIWPTKSKPAPSPVMVTAGPSVSSSWFTQSTSIAGVDFPNWSLAGLGGLAAIALLASRRR